MHFSGWNFKRIIHLNLECVKQKTLEYGCDNFIGKFVLSVNRTSLKH